MFRQKMLAISRRMQELIVPGLKYSQSIYESFLTRCVDFNDVWLDLGSGSHILPEWRLDAERRLVHKAKFVVGFDYEMLSLKSHRTTRRRVRGDASNLPFGNDMFDIVTANCVVEHLHRPLQQFGEVHRVLRPGGLFVFLTPNVFGYATILARLVPKALRKKVVYIIEGRSEEEVFPAYYRANSSRAITTIARRTGFSVQAMKMIVSSAQFCIFPPLLVFELMLIRMLMTKRLKSWRTNILAVLKKR